MSAETERDTRRASLFARYVNLRCDMTQLLSSLAAALQNSQAPPLTPEQVAEWVRDAEAYSELHETRSCALFSETVEFLSEPVATASEQPAAESGACHVCGKPATSWYAGGPVCENHSDEPPF